MGHGALERYVYIIVIPSTFCLNENLFFPDLYGPNNIRQQEAIQMHNQFSQVLLSDQYQALAAPEHNYIHVSDVLLCSFKIINLWIFCSGTITKMDSKQEKCFYTVARR